MLNNKIYHTLIAFAMLLCAPYMAGTAAAEPCTWINIDGGNWNTAGYWSCNHVPGSADDVFITTAGTYTITLNSNATVSSITMGGDEGTQILEHSANTLTINGASSFGAKAVYNLSGGELTSIGTLTIDGPFNITSPSTLAGTGLLKTRGVTTLNISRSGGMLTLDGKEWVNEGILTLEGKSYIKYDPSDGGVSMLINSASGTMNLSGSNSTVISSNYVQSFKNEGTLNHVSLDRNNLHQNIVFTNTNTGTVKVVAGTFEIPGTFTTNEGVIEVASGATLKKTSPGGFTNSGTLRGAGTIDVGAGNNLINSGTIAPGVSNGDITGTLAISGNLSFNPTSIVNIELGGVSSGAYDTLTVVGNLTLAGTLNVSVINSYAPAVEDSFTVLTFTTRGTETFSTLNLPASLAQPTYAGSYVVLNVDGEEQSSGGDTSPVITLIGANPAQVEAGTEYIEFGAAANDYLNSDLTASIVISGDVNVSRPGQYTVTYYVMDAAGNDATVYRIVNVVDTTPPTGAVLINSGANFTSNASVTLTNSCTDSGSGCSQMQFSNDGISWSGLVSYATSTTTTWILESGDGVKTVSARFIDVSDNQSSIVTAIITLDTLPPDTTITSRPAAIISSQTATFGFNSEDGGVSFECRLDGSAFAACASQVVYSGLTDTAHVFEIRATDAAQNVDPTPAAYSWIVDTVAPVITLYGASPVTVEAGASYADAGVSAADTVDGDLTKSIVATSTVNTTIPGSYTVTYNVSDAAGNAAIPVVRTVNVEDTIAPETAITAKPAAIISSQTATFGFGASEGGAAFECRLDGADFAACTSPYIASGLTDTAHAFEVRALDAALKADPTPAAYSWIVDTTAPALTVTTLTGGSVTNNDTMNITGAVTDANGLASLVISSLVTSDQTVTVQGDGTYSYAVPLEAGQNVIVIAATDLASNVTTTTRAITLDQRAPGLAITSPTDNSVTGSATVVLSGTVDETATVLVSDGTNTFTPDATGGSFTQSIALSSGPNTINVYATDDAGNTAHAQRKVTYDNANPGLAIISPGQDITTNQASITLTGTVSGFSIASVIVSDGTNTFEPDIVDNTFSQVLAFSSEGQYQITVTAEDETGRTTTVIRNIIYDVTGPAVTISPVTTPTNDHSQTISGTRDENTTVSVTSSPATVGGVVYPTSTTWRFYLALLTEGTNTITVTAADRAGNPASAAAVILLDTTNPVLTLNGAALVTVEAGTSYLDAGATAVDSADGDLTAGIVKTGTVNVIAPGTYLISYAVTDSAGNAATSVSRTVAVVDTTAPDTTITASPSAIISGPTATFEFGSPDGGVSFECRLDNAGFESCTSPAVYSGLTDTAHAFAVRAADAAQNVDPTPETYTWTVDTAAPSLIVNTLAHGSVTNNNTLNITGTVTDANGLSSLVISGQTVTVQGDNAYSHAVTLAAGPNVIAITATDLASNATTTARTITLDATSPALAITSPADNSVTNDANMTVEGTVDETSAVSIKLNDAGQASVSMTGNAFNLQLSLAYGLNIIDVFAADLAGNTTAGQRQVVFDNVNPSLAITSPDQDITTNQAGVTISGVMDDLTPTTVMVSCSTATIGLVSYPTATTWQADISQMAEGVNAITVTATDEAGNATTVIRNIIHDTTGPAFTINPATTPTNESSVSLSGTMDEGSTVEVACPTATVASVNYPTATAWEVFAASLTEGGNVFTITVRDPAGNQTVLTQTIALDTSPVAVTNVSPPRKGIMTTPVVGYSLNEAAQSGTITFTRTSGSPDDGSPHPYSLAASDLGAGSHTVNTGIVLAPGAFYTVTVRISDRAGGLSASASNDMVFYDSNYGAGPTGNVANEDGLNIVNNADVLKLKTAQGARPGDPNWDPACDLDRNNVVDRKDLMILMQHFGASH